MARVPSRSVIFLDETEAQREVKLSSYRNGKGE